jgi:carboxyl-terminal processing protease
MKGFRPAFVALLISLLFTGAVSAQVQLNSPTFQLLQQQAGAPGVQKAPDAKGVQTLDPEQLKQLGLTPDDLMKIEAVSTLMKQGWVDGDSLKSQDLMWGAMKGMAKQLDPHSDFYTPDEFKRFQDQLSGTFAGVGAILKQKKKGEGQVVQVPVPGAPADKAGVKANDMIIEVDGANVGPLSTEEVSNKIKGQPNTQVTLKIARPDPADPKKPKIVTITITRGTVTMPNVYSETLKPGVGYIYFNEFREDTANEFLKQVSALEKKGLNTLIIDERNNPGGSVQTVIKITSLFQHKGEKIVTMKDRKGNEKSALTPSEGPYVNLTVKVLINGNSASASEILAGALKDNHHAKIYGATSFGKGSAQTVIPFQDGSALKLTINKWYTPSGKSIQGDEGGLKPGVHERGGVEPDEPVTIGDEDEAKVLNRIYQKMMGAPLDPPGPIADPVLEKALQ